jgi:hypothetical protein
MKNEYYAMRLMYVGIAFASLFWISSGVTWATIAGVIVFLIALLGLAFDGRPINPNSLSWDIGMEDDFRTSGTPAKEEKVSEPESHTHLSIAAAI